MIQMISQFAYLAFFAASVWSAPASFRWPLFFAILAIDAMSTYQINEGIKKVLDNIKAK